MPDLSLLELLKKGGPVMIPLALCSVAAVAMALERFLALRREKLAPPGFIGGLDAALGGNGGSAKHVADGILYCENQENPPGRIFAAGLRALPRGAAEVERAIEDSGAREADRLHRRLRGLQVVASVAPLLGLLGTVYGMIGAFQRAATAGLGKAEQLAEGIYEALVTTAAGLTIAIPALLLYWILRSRTDVIVDALDEMAQEFALRFLTKPSASPKA